jgi:hypothetical protein
LGLGGCTDLGHVWGGFCGVYCRGGSVAWDAVAWDPVALVVNFRLLFFRQDLRNNFRQVLGNQGFFVFLAEELDVHRVFFSEFVNELTFMLISKILGNSVKHLRRRILLVVDGPELF